MVSACLAMFNGSRYIVEQVESILCELSEDDELIIYDDCSTDDSCIKVESVMDSRIKLYRNTQNVGVNNAFQNAINLCNGEYIFLVDQDDIWIKGRVKIMIEALNISNALLLVSNYSSLKGNTISSHKMAFSTQGVIKNICMVMTERGGSLLGCTMLIRRELIKHVTPFPQYLESHDIWIALTAIIQNRIYYLDEITLLRRVHANNASLKNRSIIKKIVSRLIFMVSIMDILLRYYKKRNN